MNNHLHQHFSAIALIALLVGSALAACSSHRSVGVALGDSGPIAMDAGTRATDDTGATTADAGGAAFADGGATVAKDTASGGATDAGGGAIGDAGATVPKIDAGPTEIDAGGAPIDAGGPPKGESMWLKVHKQVIVAKGCGGGYCHGGGGAMSPDPDKSHDKLLMGVTNKSSCLAGLYVTPGDPSKSLFYLKIAPGVKPGCGVKMPKGSSGVSQELADLVKKWIEAGAKKD
jgi:hypothetical protein